MPVLTLTLQSCTVSVVIFLYTSIWSALVNSSSIWARPPKWVRWNTSNISTSFFPCSLSRPHKTLDIANNLAASDHNSRWSLAKAANELMDIRQEQEVFWCKSENPISSLIDKDTQISVDTCLLLWKPLYCCCSDFPFVFCLFQIASGKV